jgi:hypothetical protein
MRYLFILAVVCASCAPRHQIIYGAGGTVVGEKNKPKKKVLRVPTQDVLSNGDTLYSNGYDTLMIIKKQSHS